MKNKIIIIALAVLGIALAILAGVYFTKQKSSPINSLESAGQPDTTTITEGKASETQEGTKTVQLPNKLVTDDFSLDIPAGWIKAEPPVGASAMAVNVKEDLNDPAAKKINFKSYFAVSYDVLQGKTMGEYVKTVKDGFVQVIPGAVFTKDRDISVGGSPAHAMEAELTQQGVNFKILMAVIAGEGEDVWIISFNTAKSSWDGYKETFYGIVNSFILKK
jgi:hypothetical protein